MFLKGIFVLYANIFKGIIDLNIYLEERLKLKILETIKVPYKNLLIHSLLYSCGGFNTPTLCVVTKGIKPDCDLLIRTTYTDASGYVDYKIKAGPVVS